MGHPEPSKVPPGPKAADINAERFVWVMTSLVGLPVTCCMKNGTQIRGYFHTFDASNKTDARGKEFCFSQAQEVAQNDKLSGEIIPKLIIPGNELLSMSALSVPLAFTAAHLEKEKRNLGKVETLLLQELSFGRERPLEKWVSDVPVEDLKVLEECSTLEPNAVDQFERNKKLFNIQSTYEPTLKGYTSPLDVSKVSESDQLRAQEIADEIDREKKQFRKYGESDGEGDEEEMFAAVRRSPPSSSALTSQSEFTKGGNNRVEEKFSGDKSYSETDTKKNTIPYNTNFSKKPPPKGDVTAGPILSIKGEVNRSAAKDSKTRGSAGDFLLGTARSVAIGSSPRQSEGLTQDTRSVDALGLEPPGFFHLNESQMNMVKERVASTFHPPESKKSFKEDSELISKKMRNRGLESTNKAVSKREAQAAHMSASLSDALQSTASGQNRWAFSTPVSTHREGPLHHPSPPSTGGGEAHPTPPLLPETSIPGNSSQGHMPGREYGEFSSHGVTHSSESTSSQPSSSLPPSSQHYRGGEEGTHRSHAFRFNPYAPTFEPGVDLRPSSSSTLPSSSPLPMNGSGNEAVISPPPHVQIYVEATDRSSAAHPLAPYGGGGSPTAATQLPGNFSLVTPPPSVQIHDAHHLAPSYHSHPPAGYAEPQVAAYPPMEHYGPQPILPAPPTLMVPPPQERSKKDKKTVRTSLLEMADSVKWDSSNECTWDPCSDRTTLERFNEYLKQVAGMEYPGTAFAEQESYINSPPGGPSMLQPSMLGTYPQSAAYVNPAALAPIHYGSPHSGSAAVHPIIPPSTVLVQGGARQINPVSFPSNFPFHHMHAIRQTSPFDRMDTTGQTVAMSPHTRNAIPPHFYYPQNSKPTTFITQATMGGFSPVEMMQQNALATVTTNIPGMHSAANPHYQHFSSAAQLGPGSQPNMNLYAFSQMNGQPVYAASPHFSPPTVTLAHGPAVNHGGGSYLPPAGGGNRTNSQPMHSP